MIVSIEKGTAFGRVTAPPSKSMSHRYLICGAFSEKSRIDNIAFSEDIKATLGCLSSLGAEIEIEGSSVKIGGINAGDSIASNQLFCNESGSTLRFMLPICLLFNTPITLKGTERLFSRSLSVYKDICSSQGIYFNESNSSVTVCGRLEAGNYSVRGDISSQFISGLMFALPRLNEDSLIEITGTPESVSYLKMTVKALADFGIRITRKDEKSFYVKGNQTFKSLDIVVEGDYSNAAFFEALNTVGGNVVIDGLCENTCQGDSVYKKCFKELHSGFPTLDISDCPDLAPILMALAAAHGGAVFKGTHRLKIKESDRGKVMADELAKFGCEVELSENEITVKKAVLKKPELPLYGHNDHRIIMALSVLCTLTGGTIYGAEAVAKSFPDFFRCLSELGIKIKVND